MHANERGGQRESDLGETGRMGLDEQMNAVDIRDDRLEEDGKNQEHTK